MKTIVFLLSFLAMSAASAFPFTAADDTGDQLWTINDIAGTETNSIFVEFEQLSLPNNAIFGIYDDDDPSRRIPIFNGGNAINEFARVEWNQVTDIASLFHSVNGVSYVFIQDEAIVDAVFGFYLTEGGVDFFSEDSLNGGLGFDPLVVVQATGDSYSLNWDTTGNGEYFNYVALADDVLPVPVSVPEPGSLMLMGLGLVGTAFGLRRNKRLQIEKRNS